MTDVAPTAISLSNVGDLAPWSPRIPSCPHVSSPHTRAYACSRERTADTCVPDRCVPDRLDLEPSREPVTEVLSLEATEVPARDEPPRDEAPVVKLFEARDLPAPPALLAMSSLAPPPPLLFCEALIWARLEVKETAAACRCPAAIWHTSRSSGISVGAYIKILDAWPSSPDSPCPHE